MHLCSPRPTPCFSHGFSNHSRKTGPTLLAVLMGSRPTSRTACGEKGRDHPPLIFTSSCFTAGAGLPTSDPMFRWPDYFQLKPSTETQLCALMCRQLHSKDRGVTHVFVQRGRKPEAERLPPGPSFFLLCDQRRMRPSRPVVCFAFAATEKVVIVLRIPRLRQGPCVPWTQPQGAQL